MAVAMAEANSKRSVAGWAVAASGWVAALAMGVLDAPAKINSFFAEAPKATENVANAVFLDRKLTGTWGLEGVTDLNDADAKFLEPPGPVSLSLTIYRGQVDGEISAAGLEKTYVHTPVMVRGMKRGDTVYAEAWDLIDGKATTLARFELIPEGRERTLRFKLVEPSQSFYFPTETLLFKFSDKPEPPAFAVNSVIMDKVTKEMNKELRAKAAAK